MFAVLTHSRLRGPRHFPAMLGATLEVRRDLRSAAGLLRATNVIAGPTEFLTLTVWTDRDAMYHFMSSGAHERVMWRWPQWLSAFWLGRLAPTDREVGHWRGLRVSAAADRGGPAHASFRAPAFASHEVRPRELERYGLRATTIVVRPHDRGAWPAALCAMRRIDRVIRGAPGLLRGASGLSLDGEFVAIALWRDEASAGSMSERLGTLGSAVWCMTWTPLDEFGTWDGDRLRHLVADAEPGRTAA